MVHQCKIKSVVMWLHMLVVSMLMCVRRIHHVPCFLCGAVRGTSVVFSVFRQAMREVTVFLCRYVDLIECSRTPFELSDLISRGRFHIDKLIFPQLAKIFSTFHEN